MTLDQMANVASVIASIAVVLTIPVLIISIRQNTKAQRAIVVDNLAAGIANINVPMTADPKIGAAVKAATEDWRTASREQRIMAHYFLYSLFKLHENAWYQMKAGILEPHIWEGWSSNIIRVYHTPGVQDVWWPARSFAFNDGFRDFLAAMPAPEGHILLTDIFDPD